MNKGSFFRLPAVVVFAPLVILMCSTCLFAQGSPPRIRYSVPGMDKVEVRRNLTFKKAEGMELKMDAYLPPSLQKETRLPAVIFIHGGYLPRDLKLLPKDWDIFISYGQLAAASGLVGVTFNHRYYGWTEKDFEVSFGDVTDAIRYVRENAQSLHVDPDRICLWGFSGGGPHLSIPLREPQDYIRCIVSYYAILDLSEVAGAAAPNLSREGAEKYSAITYLREDNYHIPPILIARAGLDSPYINRAVDLFVTRGSALNEQIDLLSHPLGRHGFDAFDDNARTREIVAHTIEFVKDNLTRQVSPYSRTAKMAARLQAMLAHGNIDAARRLAPEIGKDSAIKPVLDRIISEASLNGIGYQILRSNARQALEAFKWALELNPISPSAYDSLADAYEANGQPDLAIANAEKALELLGKDNSLSESRKNAIRDSANAKLKRLKKT